MDRPMKRLEPGRRMQQEIRGMLKLSPLVLASLLLAALVWRTDSAAISGLFQSSPVETPIPSVTSSPEPTVTATTPGPSAMPSASPGVTLTAAPTESVAPVETSTPAPPTETVSPAATSAPTEPTPTETPVASPTSVTAEPEETPDESQRYPEGESNLRFEWGMLFDSVALFLSYGWLCCGILVFLAIPVLFIVLWRASSGRQEQD
jgi:cytoskeletal protein RodZ